MKCPICKRRGIDIMWNLCEHLSPDYIKEIERFYEPELEILAHEIERLKDVIKSFTEVRV